MQNSIKVINLKKSYGAKEAVKNISKLTLAEKIDKYEKMRKIPDKKKK